MDDEELVSEAKVLDFTAFQRWEYRPIIYKADHPQLWRNLADSFFRASIFLVEKVAARELNDDMEGLAAIFLFRHYLELALKELVLKGRFLAAEDRNALRDEVQEVGRIHELKKLWEWVIRDAKPKVNPESWNEYDTTYVEKCLAEFDEVDSKGFAFRYPGQGGNTASSILTNFFSPCSTLNMSLVGWSRISMRPTHRMRNTRRSYETLQIFERGGGWPSLWFFTD